MKYKEKTDFYQIINGVCLFWDDIESIISLFQSKSLDIKIEDSENIYENLDEVLSLRGTKPKKLTIVGSISDTWESITIQVEKNRAWIHSSGSGQMRTLGFELKDFIISKVPSYYKLSRPWVFAVLTFLILWNTIVFFDKVDEAIRYWLFAVSSFFAILLMFSFIDHRLNYGLFLIRKHQFGFLKRNKDKILLVVIAAIIGSILTMLIQWSK